jgi:PAS domain S-box-containing protein
MEEEAASASFVGDPPTVSDPAVLSDRRELALVAFERTRMPIVVTDPRKRDNPIVLANEAFLALTAYTAADVIGRNCRFLQGPGTDPADVQALREGLAGGHDDISVELLNYRKDGTTFWNQLMISPVRDADGDLIYFFASQKDVTARRRAQELERAERLLLMEVDHRAMNALALVQSIVKLSRRDSAETFADAVTRRVDALACAHRLLARSAWAGADLADLLAADGVADAIDVAGPPVRLPPHLVQPLAVVLQELFANARQHGALSHPLGKVALRWNASPFTLEVHWLERWQPLTRPRRSEGLGLDLVQGVVHKQLAGTVELDWGDEGLQAHLTIPW